MRRLAGVTMLLLSGGTLFASLGSTSSCGTSTQVRGVYTALDGTGERRRTHFFTDTARVFCNVDFVGDRKDITVNAILRLLKSEPCPALFYPNPAACQAGNALTSSWGVPPTDTNVVVNVTEQAPGPGATTLTFNWTPQQPPDPDAGSSNTTLPPPWPVGTYRCEIYVDGALQGSAGFQVTFPTDGTNDTNGGAQAYPTQGKCPVGPVAAGNPCWDYVVPGQQCLSGLGRVCTCPQDKGVWVCQP